MSKILKPCFFAGLLFLSSLAFAEKINFPLASFSGTASVPIEWSEKFFGRKSSFEYDHDLARLACYFSDAAYSDVAENPTENNLFTAYKKIGVKESDIEARYDIDYSDAMWGNDQCAFSIASKKIQSAKGSETLIFVVIRGTPLNASEWLSNLNISDAKKSQKSIHEGFSRAASILHTALISYMLRRQINPTNAFLFITGHSRGAAVANMLSSLILEDDFFKAENIYTYTFASPNVTTRDDAESDKYGFIWNIVNAEDIVPTVPMNREKWKFHKFGHTLAFSNQANTDSRIYIEEIVPKINEIYEKLSGREYKPFTTGPFVPIVVTRLVEKLSGDVEKYYSGAVALHEKATNLMLKLFPEKKDENDEEKPEESDGGLGSWLVSYLNRRTNGLVDYVKLALADMHSNDVYLSYMLALDENAAFSDLGYSLVVVKGYEEFAVFDSEENLMARVIDGKIIYSDMKFPIILCPALGKNVIVGYPSSMDFKIYITDEALISTPANLDIEYFDAAGVYKLSEPKYIYPRMFRVYSAELGNCVFRNCGIYPQKISLKKDEAILKKAHLRPQMQFHIAPELNMNLNRDFSLGLHFGCPLIFASVMTMPSRIKPGKSSGEVDFGIGNQQTLFSQIKMENEIFGKFIWLKEDDDKFNFVPQWRTSLSLKVLGRMRFFVAGTFDFNIKDFNDATFGKDRWIEPIKSFSIGNSVEVVPNVQFGVRF